MFEDLSLIEIIAKGGVAVYVLLVFSVVALGVIFERSFYYARFRSAVANSLAKLKSEGLSSIGTDDTPLNNVLRAALAKKPYGKDEILRAVELALRYEQAALKGLLAVLATIGATAPFVGLFGTVIGIIRAFDDLADTSNVGVYAVADGISEALVATAAGLFVAIPAVIAYNYFSRRSARMVLTLEVSSSEFVSEIIKEEKETGEKKEVKGGL